MLDASRLCWEEKFTHDSRVRGRNAAVSSQKTSVNMTPVHMVASTVTQYVTDNWLSRDFVNTTQRVSSCSNTPNSQRPFPRCFESRAETASGRNHCAVMTFS